MFGAIFEQSWRNCNVETYPQLKEPDTCLDTHVFRERERKGEKGDPAIYRTIPLQDKR